jgi:hypothetical protein
VLIREADLRAGGARRGREILAGDADRAAARYERAGHRGERRALAGAVGAEQERDLTGGEREVDAVDGDSLAVVDGELADLGDGHCW